MSVHYDPDRNRFVVRWREDGRQRSRRFATEADALAFDEARRAPRSANAPPERASPAAGDAIYAYPTKAGLRYRFVFRQSDGTLSSRRGFSSRQAAATGRRKLLESIDRGEVVVCREEFGDFWARFAEQKRPYLTSGSFVDLSAHDRKRLLPFFEADRLADLDADRVREWLAQMVELVEAGEVAPKTVNNARTYLSMALNEAVRRGLVARNACADVPALPIERAELEYLRLAEIERYLDACSAPYRPLAAFLIGTGARISEAVAARWTDLDIDEGVIRINRQRATHSIATRATKGKRFRSVQMGPRLCESLAAAWRARLAGGVSDDGWIFSARHHVAAVTPGGRRPFRPTGRPCTTGTRRRSRTPASAICRSTRCATPPPRRGLPPASRSCSCSGNSDIVRSPPPRTTTGISKARSSETRLPGRRPRSRALGRRRSRPVTRRAQP
jgi:integrase